MHELFIRRCFDLARLGAGRVSPNPMVGAVLVYQGRIIGEGYHEEYGKAHAEVNAFASVSDADRSFLPAATLYVSLEPCCIFGKTPPCTDLIQREGVKQVVVSCLDATPAVAGKGIALLRNAGIEVITGVLEEEGLQLARIRNTMVTDNRPYIMLKAAVSADGFIGRADQQIRISDSLSARLVHKWRSEHPAILVGTNTAATDDPALTLRYYPGYSPLRITIDRNGRLPAKLQLLQDDLPTWIMTCHPDAMPDLPSVKRIIPFRESQSVWSVLFAELMAAGKSSLLVEGGAAIFSDLLKQELWDEIRLIQSPDRIGKGGIPLPKEMLSAVDSGEPLDRDVLRTALHPRHIR